MRNPIDLLKCLENMANNPNYNFKRLHRNLYNMQFYAYAAKNLGLNFNTDEFIIFKETLSLIMHCPSKKITDLYNYHLYNIKSILNEMISIILQSIYKTTVFHKKSTALTFLTSKIIHHNHFITGSIDKKISSKKVCSILRKRINDEYLLNLIRILANNGQDFTFVKLLDLGYRCSLSEFPTCFVAFSLPTENHFLLALNVKNIQLKNILSMFNGINNIFVSSKKSPVFLGYCINFKRNNAILTIPKNVFTETLLKYHVAIINNNNKFNLKPVHRSDLLYLPEKFIFNIYCKYIHNFLNLYSMAKNKLLKKQFVYVMYISMLKTIAAKHQTNINAIKNFSLQNKWKAGYIEKCMSGLGGRWR